MRHGIFSAAVFVVVVLWCLLFVCTSSLRLDAFFVGVFVWLPVSWEYCDEWFVW